MAKPKITRICKQCGNPFHVWPSIVKRGGGGYCSALCWQKARTKTLEERYFPFIGPTTESGCILWVGQIDDHGYGIFKVAKRTVRPHRVAFEIAGNVIPKGHSVLHRCDNPPCINPQHLFSGTQADNNRDRDQKNRTAKGASNGRSKLTGSTVLEARALHAKGDVTYAELAYRYGVSPCTLKSAITGQTWKHV